MPDLVDYINGETEFLTFSTVSLFFIVIEELLYIVDTHAHSDINQFLKISSVHINLFYCPNVRIIRY